MTIKTRERPHEEARAGQGTRASGTSLNGGFENKNKTIAEGRQLLRLKFTEAEIQSDDFLDKMRVALGLETQGEALKDYAGPLRLQIFRLGGVGGRYVR